MRLDLLPTLARQLNSLTMTLLGIVTALSLSTRFYNLSTPAYVCWDETHFGKFAGHYINRTYFVDVHPPLGKMLIALIGLLTGYDGKFGFFSPGDEYITESINTKYYGMRAFNALLGSLTIPLLFCTMKNVTHSNGAALLTAVFLIFDCGLITLSQYILLDPILLFFMSSSLLCTSMYSSLSSKECHSSANCAKPFSWHWWLYLALSGLFLGCAISVKWTGFFTAIFIVCWNAISLHNEQKNNDFGNFVTHTLLRAIFVIFVPCCVYVSVFALHYQVLSKTGKSDGFHSSLFQSCLQGNPLHNASMPLHLAYGSVISLKYHHPSVTGLLHSHNDIYPLKLMEAPQNQVSLYYHRDVDNFWQVIRPLEYVFHQENDHLDKGDGVEYLRDGSVMSLMHFQTKRYLSSDTTPSVISPREFIVSGKDDASESLRSNHLWRLEVVAKPGNNARVEVLSTTFKLVHVNSGCYLRSSAKVLPKWGGERYEVTCSPYSYHANWSLWNVEQHTHRNMDDGQVPFCQMTFWEKFWESHMAMLSFHSQFQTLENGSRVWHWPLNYKGQAFSRMGEDDTRVYLLGNPLIFLLNLSVLLSSLLFIFVGYRISRKSSLGAPIIFLHFERGINATLTWRKIHAKNFLSMPHFHGCMLFLFGWGVHYIPFFFVSRVVYFHHYYPASLLSSCLSGIFLDYAFSGCSVYLSHLFGSRLMPSWVMVSIYAVFILCLLESFYLYSPLCYGMTGHFSAQADSIMHGLNIFGEWDI